MRNAEVTSKDILWGDLSHYSLGDTPTNRQSTTHSPKHIPTTIFPNEEYSSDTTTGFARALSEPDTQIDLTAFGSDSQSIPLISYETPDLEDYQYRSVFERVWEDHRNYYSSHNLGLSSLGLIIGGTLANTNADEGIYKHFNSSVTGASSDDWGESFHSPKNFGDGLYTLPVFAAAWGIGSLFEETDLGDFSSEWGECSLRAIAVGAPPVLLMQMVLGSGRPEEGGSNWNFWNDSNGVSGHSFMGAIPFLTAAQIAEDPMTKLFYYAASTAVPLSRLSDGDHYPSQIFLGWFMALTATKAIDATRHHDDIWRILPLIGPDYSGIGYERRW